MNDVKNEKFNRTQVNQELLKDYVGGKYEISENIEFDNVPIVTPNGDILIKKMKIDVRKIFLKYLKLTIFIDPPW